MFKFIVLTERREFVPNILLWFCIYCTFSFLILSPLLFSDFSWVDKSHPLTDLDGADFIPKSF